MNIHGIIEALEAVAIIALLLISTKLYRLAFKDQLTDLWNSRYLYKKGQGLIDSWAKKNLLACVFFIDLDNLGLINNAFSHDVGDLALKKIADTLINLFSKKQLIARRSGDEFIIVTNFSSFKSLLTAEISLKAKLSDMQIEWHEKGIPKSQNISATYGLIWGSAKMETFSQLMDNADRMMLHDKKLRTQKKAGA